MSRFLGVAIAGVLWFAAAGCAPDSFLVPGIVIYGPKVIAPGSVSQVSAKLQDGLSDAGIMVRINRVGSVVRLSGKTKSGKVFCLHLHEKADKDGVQTHVRVQWDLGGDEAFWQMIVKLVAAPQAATEDASDASDGGPSPVRSAPK